jgi:hypothetical protein
MLDIFALISIGALLSIFPEEPAADRQQHIPEIQIDDVGLFTDAEVDRPVLP